MKNIKKCIENTKIFNQEMSNLLLNEDFNKDKILSLYTKQLENCFVTSDFQYFSLNILFINVMQLFDKIIQIMEKERNEKVIRNNESSVNQTSI